MQSGSIASSFQFLNYKIDLINFVMNPIVDNLLLREESVSVEFSVAVRNLSKFKNNDKIFYVSGLNSKIVLKNKNETIIAKGEFSVSGIFCSDGALAKDTELALAKMQAPTILFPYLRSTVTNILASAGYGGIILPLVNVVALAKKSDIKIEELPNKDTD